LRPGQTLGTGFLTVEVDEYMNLLCCEAKLSSLKWKTWPKQLFDYLPLPAQTIITQVKAFIIYIPEQFTIKDSKSTVRHRANIKMAFPLLSLSQFQPWRQDLNH
jgi:hypothetical protein